MASALSSAEVSASSSWCLGRGEDSGSLELATVSLGLDEGYAKGGEWAALVGGGWRIGEASL